MFTVRENGIVNSTVVITGRTIGKFRCADGWIDIVRYDRLEQLFNLKFDSGNGISLHRPVFYGTLAPSVADEAFQGIPLNLLIRTTKYAYQREYRIIGSRPVEWCLKPDENRPGRKIEEYGHVEPGLVRPSGLLILLLNQSITVINQVRQLSEDESKFKYWLPNADNIKTLL